MADLSSQEMARSVPTVLDKVARLRPRVVCFIGKGIWLHVERSLRLQADGSEGSGLVVRPTDRCLTLKEEEIDNLMPRASVNPDARPAKPEPEPTAFHATTDSARQGTEGGYVLRRYLLAVQKAEESSDTGSLSSSPSTTARGGGIASRASRKAAARSAFAYGLQPYKAVHDAATNVSDPHLRTRIIEIFCLTALFCSEIIRARDAVLRPSEHFRARCKPSGASHLRK